MFVLPYTLYFSPPGLVDRKDSVAQENQTSKSYPGNALSGKRRSMDREVFELYDRRLSLSLRE